MQSYEEKNPFESANLSDFDNERIGSTQIRTFITISRSNNIHTHIGLLNANNNSIVSFPCQDSTEIYKFCQSLTIVLSISIVSHPLHLDNCLPFYSGHNANIEPGDLTHSIHSIPAVSTSNRNETIQNNFNYLFYSTLNVGRGAIINDICD